MSFKREPRVQMEKGDSGEKDLCRDFKKGYCTRGERCIYHHPKLDVCRDYQNGRCTRPSCRFIHATREEEEAYTQSGIIPSDKSNGQTIQSNPIGGTQIGIDFGYGGYDGILGKRNFDTMSRLIQTPMHYGQENKPMPDLCRDFDKGECSRGEKCRYYHPKLKICRDFQNQKCERKTCRFLHMTREEESTYESSGKAPDHLDREEVEKKRVMNPSSDGGAVAMNDIYGKRMRGDNLDPMAAKFQNAQELCRDFEKGECRRGSGCRHYHPKLIICRDFQSQKCERDKCRFIHMTREEEAKYDSSGAVPDHIDKEEVKKKKVMNPSPQRSDAEIMGKIHNGQGDLLMGLSNPAFAAVVQENVALNVELTEMQQQITELRKMNDILYQQNANYRKNSILP